MSTFDASMSANNEILGTFTANAQSTYAPVMRDTFYTLVPSNFKYYYYNTIRRVLNWYQGYVPEVHKAAAGVFSTGIGNSIIKEITKLIIGGRVFFENKFAEKSNAETKDGKVNETLKTFNEWSDRFKFQDTVKRIVELAAAGGSTAIASYITDTGDLIAKPYRIDQCFYNVDFAGRCTDFLSFIGSYTAKAPQGQNRTEAETNYYVVEKRYYNDKMKPMMKYAVHWQYGNVCTAPTFDISQTTEAGWVQLPRRIQNELKRDYPNIKFGIEQPINFTEDLGVFIFNWTVENRIPEVALGESALLNILGYLLEWEMEESHFVTDMYISKGKVIVPEEWRNPTENYGGFYSGFDSLVYSQLPMRNMQDQKPFPIQFDMRSEQHARSRNNIAEKIASTIGTSGSDLFSFLRDAAGGSKTATQIAAESQKTISYIEEKRSLIVSALSDFVRLWKTYYKQPDDIIIRFSSQNMVNKMVTIDEIRMKKEIALSPFDLFKELYPDLDDTQINEKVKRSLEYQRQQLEMQSEVQAKAMENHLKTLNGNTAGKGTVEKGETDEEVEMDETKEKQEKDEGASANGGK